ncbi:hypothetical protein EYF80_010840 [Liparis tanakae]|uniref:Uncharacterized protein n=1 Tax=Liparis tanakae TaxID=230148 RepID=A0A4Z2IN59_9TELE|nr:hypothetical protein EYF80_010840 [Liparis tanakae]
MAPAWGGEVETRLHNFLILVLNGFLNSSPLSGSSSSPFFCFLFLSLYFITIINVIPLSGLGNGECMMGYQ